MLTMPVANEVATDLLVIFPKMPPKQLLLALLIFTCAHAMLWESFSENWTNTPHSDPERDAAFAMLELTLNASQTEIEQAYRKLSFRFHPDRNPAPDANKRLNELLSARFLLLASLDSTRTLAAKCKSYHIFLQTKPVREFMAILKKTFVLKDICEHDHLEPCSSPSSERSSFERSLSDPKGYEASCLFP
jgi:hypothetical protein